MKIVLRYLNGFGNIVRLFPLAAHLAKTKGNQVFFECNKQYASILGLIDYAKWKDPAEPMEEIGSKKVLPSEVLQGLEALEIMKADPLNSSELIAKETVRLRKSIEDCPVEKKALYDLAYPLQIWPGRWHQYRTEEPPKKFLDFITEGFGSDFRKMDKKIVFTSLPDIERVRTKYNLPKEFSLACACGSAQTHPVGFDVFEGWMCGIARKDRPIYHLTSRGFRPNRLHVSVEDLSEMATLIHHATEFFTINAAPAAIACGQFQKKPLRESWHHISPRVPRERFQDDIGSPLQTRWEVTDPGTGERIVRQKN